MAAVHVPTLQGRHHVPEVGAYKFKSPTRTSRELRPLDPPNGYSQFSVQQLRLKPQSLFPNRGALKQQSRPSLGSPIFSPRAIATIGLPVGEENFSFILPRQKGENTYRLRLLCAIKHPPTTNLLARTTNGMISTEKTV